MPTVTPIYAALLAMAFIVLSLRVILVRRRLQVGFGHAGDADLERRARAHANFAEYVPLTLLVMGMAELRGAPPWGLHAMGVSLMVGRVCHAVWLGRDGRDELGRIVGMAGTQSALLGGVILIAASYHG